MLSPQITSKWPKWTVRYGVAAVLVLTHNVHALFAQICCIQASFYRNSSPGGAEVAGPWHIHTECIKFHKSVKLIHNTHMTEFQQLYQITSDTTVNTTRHLYQQFVDSFLALAWCPYMLLLMERYMQSSANYLLLLRCSMNEWSQWELFYSFLETILFIIRLNSRYCFPIVDFR